MQKESIEFAETLDALGLTCVEFLDLKDEWDKLPWSDQNKMLNDAINRDVAVRGKVRGKV